MYLKKLIKLPQLAPLSECCIFLYFLYLLNCQNSSHQAAYTYSVITRYMTGFTSVTSFISRFKTGDYLGFNTLTFVINSCRYKNGVCFGGTFACVKNAFLKSKNMYYYMLFNINA